MHVPLLSESDPKQSQEGTIDPLGTYAIADALAVLLSPGVRERQSRPRFLTAMAVSFAVCREFDEDRIAADKVSEPWQVFEWYFVESMVRVLGTSGKLNRVPGTDKVTTSIREGLPISASRYLKTPRVFGFHGVYRTLARELDVEAFQRLGDTGYELLSAWATDQGLDGFHNNTQGTGRRMRQILCDAVEDGLSKGHTCRSAGWEGWKFLAEHLAPHTIGKQEGKALVRALMRDGDGFRRPVMDFLISAEGQSLITKQKVSDSLPEKAFHNGLRRSSEGPLRNLLDTIVVYERFSRLLQDAFDDCLFEMSNTKLRLSVSSLGEVTSVKAACDRAPDLFEQLLEMLAPYDLSVRFQETFSDLSERQDAVSWARSLMEHHRRIQRIKPPNGKSPWFERFDDGTYLIRPAYVRDSLGLHEDEYVHYYRTGPLSSFARDLGLVN
jgi:hypothetical protein